MDGWVHPEVGFIDMNTKTGIGSLRATVLEIDRDGDKVYGTCEGSLTSGGVWKGTWSWTKGTGKYEGITGQGTWVNYSVAPGQTYSDWEGQAEWPR